MFSGFMVNAWVVASIVAVVAGLVGFFTVLRGSAFVAHAIPNGSFAGAAGASLIGVSTLLGFGVFAVLGALTVGLLSRRGRHDVATALTLVTMLGLGALFVSLNAEYASETYSLLFGEILGVSTSQLVADGRARDRLRRRDHDPLPPADALVAAAGRRGSTRHRHLPHGPRVPRRRRARHDDDRARRRARC